MLFGQQRGRGKQQDLTPSGHRQEGRPQGNLGFAKTHITADQPIHGSARNHILDHGMNRRQLIGGLLESESFAEGLIVARIEGEGMALAGGAAGIKVEQFGGGVAGLAGGAATGLLPLSRAQLMQGRSVG